MPTTLSGWPGIGWSAEYGGVPRVPDPRSSMQEALAGDIGSLGRLYDLSRGVSSAAAEGARTQYAANLPYFTPMMQQGSQNILANLEGLVNPDVINLIGTQAATRGVGFGPDSPGTNAAYLAALGLTSQQRQDVGQQQLTAAIGRTPVGPMFNPATMLTTPEQMQEAGYQANVLAAAPYPGSAAAAAEAAARRGISAGAGAVPGTSGALARLGAPVAQPYSEPGTYVGSAPAGTGLTYGGVNYPAGSTPTSAAENWQRWAQGLSGTRTSYDIGGFWDDMFAYEPSQPPPAASAGAGPSYTTGDFWEQMFEDYDPFGVMGPYEGADLNAPALNTTDPYFGDFPVGADFGDLYP